MSPVLVSEIRKILTTRLWWIALICILVLGGGYATVPAAVAVLDPAAGPSAFSDPGTVRSIYNGGNTLTRILALVVGVMAMGNEYRHRTLGSTYLATPHRWRVIAAKAGSLMIFGLLFGLVSVLAGVLVAVPFIMINNGEFLLLRGDTWRSLGLGVLSIALWTMIGMGIGTLLRSMIVAMLVGIGFAYVLEPALTVLFFVQDWQVPLNLMPSGATNAMLGVNSPVLFASDQPYAWWQGTLVLAGWCLLPALVGVLVTVRRDVN